MGNRENILDCAQHLFYEKGYDAVGVQEIVDVAGITKPTLYYYFKSKSGLLESLLENRLSPIHNNLRNAVDYAQDVQQALMNVARVYLWAAADNKEFYFMMLSLFYMGRGNEAYKLVRPYFTEQFEIIISIFHKFSYQLGNMNGRQEQFAVGFTGIINTEILVYYQRNEDANGLRSESLIYSLVHQFMHGIYS